MKTAQQIIDEVERGERAKEVFMAEFYPTLHRQTLACENITKIIKGLK